MPRLVSARSAEKARSAVDIITSEPGAGTAEPVVLDLANLQSVRACAATLAEQGAVGAVVCNAGVAPDRAGNRVSALGAPHGARPTDSRRLWASTTSGTSRSSWRSPPFRACPGTRVVIHVFVASTIAESRRTQRRDPTLGDLSGLASGHNFDMCDGKFDGNKAYKDSKLCGILFARELRVDSGTSGATCNAFSPGFVPTSGLFRHQSAPVRALLRFAFDHPPLATSMENAGRFTTHMVLGREPGDVRRVLLRAAVLRRAATDENQVGGVSFAGVLARARVRGERAERGGVRRGARGEAVEHQREELAARAFNVVGSVLERRHAAASPSRREDGSGDATRRGALHFFTIPRASVEGINIIVVSMCNIYTCARSRGLRRGRARRSSVPLREPST